MLADTLAASRIPTPELNRFLSRPAGDQQPPAVRGKRLKMYYMAQYESGPPRFAVQVNDRKGLITAVIRLLHREPAARALRARGRSTGDRLQDPDAGITGKLPAAMTTFRTCQTTSSCSPPSRSPRATRTRSPTRSPTASSTRSCATTRTAAWRARRSSTPASSWSRARSPPTRTWTCPKIARETIRRDRLHRRRVRLRLRHLRRDLTAIDEQSPDIAQGVDKAYESRTIPATTTSSTSRAPATRA